VTQDKVISVQLQKTVQFDLVSTDLTGNRLRAKRSDGVVEDWSLTGLTLPIVNEKEEPLSLTTLNQSGATLLNVTFKGKSPIKVKAIATTYGRVSAVNTANSSIDVVNSAGNVVTKSFQSTPTVMRNGTVIGSLSSVKADDRVEIRLDDNDRPIIDIIPAVNKKYLNNNADTLFVQRASLNENNTYLLHSQVYIHQGTKTLTFADLKNNDDIVLYVLRGKVIEIAK
jgi:hypothetical protein